jgi:hypothetical protein
VRGNFLCYQNVVITINRLGNNASPLFVVGYFLDADGNNLMSVGQERNGCWYFFW